MKTNKFSPIFDSKDIFNDIGESLKNGPKYKNKDNYNNFKSKVENQIDNYDKVVSEDPDELSTLNALWEKDCDEKTTATNMYSTKREEIVKLKNDLLKINGNGVEYKCPICELDNVEHLDHYIPISIMPEFAVMPKNLIFLCEKCNTKKKDKWLDTNCNRIIFNVYFDKPSKLDILKCNIIESNGLPYAEIIENSNISQTQNSILELQTYKELDIIKRYQSKVNDVLKQECLRLQNIIKEGKNNGKDFELIWEEYLKIFIECLKEINLDVINHFLYQGITESTYLKSWGNSEYQKI